MIVTEDVASNHTQSVIKTNCPVFASRDKDTFHEYRTKILVCFLLYGKHVFNLFQGKTLSSSAVGIADTKTLKSVAEWT